MSLNQFNTSSEANFNNNVTNITFTRDGKFTFFFFFFFGYFIVEDKSAELQERQSTLTYFLNFNY